MPIRAVTLIASIALAVLMITAAFLFSGRGSAPGTVSAVGTDELLAAYASKDTDGDGLFDWEEALYDTDPENPNSVREDLTDSEAVQAGQVTISVAPRQEQEGIAERVAALPGVNAPPGTVTGDFALSFFGEYIAALGPIPPAHEDIVAYTEKKIAGLYETQTIPSAFDFRDATASQSGVDALRAYASRIDLLFTNPDFIEERTEVEYFYDAVVHNDLSVLPALRNISANYTQLAHAFVRTPVPPEAQSAHVAIANALARLSTAVSDMSVIDTDPLLGFIGISEYREAGRALIRAYREMEEVFGSANVVIEAETPGAIFYQTLRDSAALAEL